MQFKNEDGWNLYVQNNGDSYGKACVDYARRWAELMESALASGAALTDIAVRTSHDADTEGMTGFMYGAAVAMLSQCWMHGEELRRWHNLETQLGKEGEAANESGGVLNPALLSINRKKE